MSTFDEPVDYDACTHRNTTVDVSGADTPEGSQDRMCADCGHTWTLSSAEQHPTASLASPVRYRRIDGPEVVDTIDGRVTAIAGDYVVEHIGRGQQRVLPAWVFEALYWPDGDDHAGR